MTLSEELARLRTVFIDTAPIIYYIEAHSQFGPLAKEIVNAFQSGKLIAFSSVITLVEVLPKPVETGDEKLVKQFSDFLKNGKNISMVDISADIAESAGKLRGRYTFLRPMDAIQIAVSLKVEADAFITNDIKLKQIDALKIIILKDYISLNS
jgi:predicted nucleic acid-binding protein